MKKPRSRVKSQEWKFKDLWITYHCKERNIFVTYCWLNAKTIRLQMIELCVPNHTPLPCVNHHCFSAKYEVGTFDNIF